MDTSELYIKMCDCPEIQEWASILPNGFYYDRQTIIPFIANMMGEMIYPIWTEKLKKVIYLPRQDQIQDMLGTFIWTNVLMERCFKGEYSSELPMDTWEKRWLHLYMQEKHKKIWGGEGWIEWKQ